MKLTKVDGISHYKSQDLGILKTEKTKEVLINDYKNIDKKGKKFLKMSDMTTKEIVETRFNAQIESKIYSEFIRKNGKGKVYSIGLNGVQKDIVEDGVKALFMLLAELYTGKENKLWERDFFKIDLDIIEKIEVMGKRKYKFQYKLNEKTWLYKEQGQKEGITFRNLLKDVVDKNKVNSHEVRNSESFEKLRDTFNKYKERKKEIIVNSINNNNIKIRLDETGKIAGCNKKEKYFVALVNEMFNRIDEDILTTELNFLFSDKIKKFLEKINDIFSKVEEKAKEENESVNIKRIKANILNELRNYFKENKKEEEKSNVGIAIYEEELKKYIETTFSKTKEKGKSKGELNDVLYLNFLKKNLCIKDNKMDLDKLKKIIEDNFKNRFTSHILDYGKLLYYKNDMDGVFKDIVQFETKDLEYIKTKETLIRKLSTMVSFSTYVFYNLHDMEDHGLYFEDIISKYEDMCKKSVFPSVENSVFKFPPLNEKRLNYFFNEKNIENKEEFVYEIYQSIYDIRNKVVHFKNEEMSEFKKETIKEFFKKEKEGAVNKLTEKFLSNNLEYYFSEECLKNYFLLYDYKLLKTIIPFAPKFKRIIEKGEKLYRAGLQKQNKEEYNWFLRGEIDLKTTKEYIRTKNFLLSELYYNNFYGEFLEDRVSFKNAVDKAKKRKKESGESFVKDNSSLNISDKKKSGTSYGDIEEYNVKLSIEDYVAKIHKLEMDRLKNEEKFDEEKSKETAHFLNEYIEDVFLEGFLTWLNKESKKNSLEGLLCQLNEDEMKLKIKSIKEKNKTNNNLDRNNVLKIMLDEFNKKIAHQLEIIPEDKEVLRVYLFLNMNDSKRINEFNNEIIKYEQFLKKRKIEETKFLSINTEVYRALCEFTLLTKEQLSSEKTNENEILFKRLYDNNKVYDDILKRFVDEEVINNDKQSKEEQLYFQTDGGTPILHSTLENTRKFSTQDFISKIILKYTLEQKGVFDKFQEKIEGKTKIEKIQEEKNCFHEKWKKNNNAKTAKFILNNKKEYLNFLSNINNIRKYNYLKNKQGLQNVYEFHKIISDIQARYIAFINKYERDFKFFMTAIKSLDINNNYKIETFLEPKDKEQNKENFNISKYKKIVEKFPKLDQNLVSLLFNTNVDGNIRNYIAHFKHFTDFNEETRSSYSFVQQMNYLINLFSYDKKVKNHINKSLKTILEKYNMEIQFEVESESNIDIYKIKNTIKSIVGKQLGETYIFEGKNKSKEEEIYNKEKKWKYDKDYCFYLLENEFLEDVKKMLEYKYTNSKK